MEKAFNTTKLEYETPEIGFVILVTESTMVDSSFEIDPWHWD